MSASVLLTLNTNATIAANPLIPYFCNYVFFYACSSATVISKHPKTNDNDELLSHGQKNNKHFGDILTMAEVAKIMHLKIGLQTKKNKKTTECTGLCIAQGSVRGEELQQQGARE